MSAVAREVALADEEHALRAQLAASRAELGAAMHALRASAAATLAPRERLRRNPYAWLGAAAGVGFWLALRLPPPGSRS